MGAYTVSHYCPCCPLPHQGIYERCIVCINNGFKTSAERRVFLDAGGEERVVFGKRVHECSSCGKARQSRYWGICPCEEPIYNPETSSNARGGTKYDP